MEKYKVNENIKKAVECAASKAGSFKQLADAIDDTVIDTIILQLITDGQFEELSKTTLFTLMPTIQEFLPGEERKKIIQFLSQFNTKGQHNG